MARNTISIMFDSDRPLTQQEQEAILVQIELALTEPQTFTVDDDGLIGEWESADWRLTNSFAINADFPVGR